MATIPSVVSVVAGTRFRVALYTAIKAFLDFLIDTPHSSVFHSTTTALPNLSGGTLLAFDSETDDSDSMHSTVTNNSRLVFTTAGRYELIVFVSLSAATYTGLDVHMRLNAAGVIGGGTSIKIWTFASASVPHQLIIPLSRVFAASDYIEIFVNQNSGGAATTLGGNQYATGVQARMIGLT